ncbi:N5-carboxyaminoimidazole ribonucleotide mutase [Enhygromyxa salina]|uniref:N5-carboxyaminoimidazole ribonucleotide mutase n=1 Tax=Enhygromyxa salina TaxID=215803 RepID=A0A2S9XIT4_9BACT|nr:5-(carboxyamino)imidazole ribonucleotide mutase [Enhygromyxa salina]PRP92788.1 N5-carboxyaminoimidazole ribonucleotide mutase [Enhygromyxa salina]
MTESTNIQVGILMGSESDWPTMQHAALILDELGVANEARVLSAHRSPHAAAEYAESAAGRGLQVIICAAGGAAHLGGVIAAHTHLPVLGVPMKGWSTDGLDALLSTVQMPSGIPVGTLAIGKAGARNAALLAVSIMSLSNEDLRGRYLAYREAQTRSVLETELPPAGSA